MNDKEPSIKTASEESKKTPPILHEGGNPLTAEKPEGAAPEREKLTPSPENKTEGKKEETEGKEKSESKENPLAGVSTKDLLKEVQRRLAVWMNKK